MFRQVLVAVVLVSVCRACTYNPTCKETYIVAVANGDSCTAAQAFQTCVSTMLAGCSHEQTLQPPFSDDISDVDNALLSYCQGNPPAPPGGLPPPPPNTMGGGVAPPNTNGGIPPPPPPPQPTAPPQPTGCQINPACESTYTTAVSSGNACSAAETFVTCMSANADQCAGSIPSTISTTLEYARQQKTEKCNEPPPPVPGVPPCAQICVQYKTSGQDLISQGQIPAGCSKLYQFISCLQSQGSSCDTSVAVQQSQTDIVTNCSDPSKFGNCSTQFEICNKGLTSLPQSKALCDLWYVCKNVDFSACGKNLTQNLDTQCANSPTSAPSTGENGSSTLDAGFLLVFFCYVISAMLQQRFRDVN